MARKLEEIQSVQHQQQTDFKDHITNLFAKMERLTDKIDEHESEIQRRLDDALLDERAYVDERMVPIHQVDEAGELEDDQPIMDLLRSDSPSLMPGKHVSFAGIESQEADNKLRRLEVDMSALESSTGSSHRGVPSSYSSPKDSLDKLGRSLTGKSRFIFPGGDSKLKKGWVVGRCGERRAEAIVGHAATRTKRDLPGNHPTHASLLLDDGIGSLSSVDEREASRPGGIRKPKKGVGVSFDDDEGGDALEVESTRVRFGPGASRGKGKSNKRGGIGGGLSLGSEMSSGSSLSTDIEILEQRNRARLRRLRAIETGGATTSESDSVLDQTLAEDSFASQPSMRPIEADQLDQLLRDYLTEEKDDDHGDEPSPVVARRDVGELVGVETRWIG